MLNPFHKETEGLRGETVPQVGRDGSKHSAYSQMSPLPIVSTGDCELQLPETGGLDATVCQC